MTGGRSGGYNGKLETIRAIREDQSHTNSAHPLTVLLRLHPLLFFTPPFGSIFFLPGYCNHKTEVSAPLARSARKNSKPKPFPSPSRLYPSHTRSHSQ